MTKALTARDYDAVEINSSQKNTYYPWMKPRGGDLINDVVITFINLNYAVVIVTVAW